MNLVCIHNRVTFHDRLYAGQHSAGANTYGRTDVSEEVDDGLREWMRQGVIIIENEEWTDNLWLKYYRVE